MPAMAAASGTATMTPPNSSQAEFGGWRYGSSGHHENNHFADYDAEAPSNGVLAPQSGNSNYDPYAADSYAASRREPRSNSRDPAPSEPKRPRTSSSPPKDGEENSKWIHRDKLAKIESEELQAAGIILPKPRAPSKSRRDRSQERMNGNRRGTDISDHQPLPRSGRGSDLSFDKTPEAETPPWDLRLPEEIAEDPGEYWVSNGSVKGSRIPVAKLSPAPISTDHLGRPVSRKSSIPFNDGTPLHLPKARSRSNSAANALEATPKIQPGKRSATEGSPKKGATTGARKASVTSKSGAPGRPKTRSGPSPRSTSSTRPTTRSGELSPRAPEGDPPWMVSAYKPDPRLPPDQQLLPTVAKRLQQEKWEQEGKFGSVYDKEFRPLNDESFAKPPELEKPGEIDAKEEERQEERHDEWPLRPDAKAANASRPGTSSYSTMPKIEDKPARTSPHPSPRPVQQPKMQSMQAPQNAGREGPPEQPQEKPKKAGCGCCIVM